MTMAFRRDFLTPHEPELPRRIALRGLRAFAKPRPATLCLTVPSAWATERRFTDDAIERYAERFDDRAKQATTP